LMNHIHHVFKDFFVLFDALASKDLYGSGDYGHGNEYPVHLIGVQKVYDGYY